ncbi:di-heme oxidoredictase family protein [Cellvibrio sp. QJXJ]|uniref:di-heme oxidoredictase family protein n=1 Tax=Cellvibrio sp. QJXJ TaxID=2964606 RepID=UPI0021C4353C|nr:di-heme oxidoredictase family protein [Cellvibrio sp. QJXJ]UUA74310.1 discoidin domain-containing protein [Cellvibrio sp. QJXJ]
MRIMQFGRRMLLALVALSSVSAIAQTININPVSATGSTSLQPASYAIDNIGTTRWESNHGVSPSSLTLDLGQVYNLSQVVILWEAANAERYEILGSNNNSTWTQLALRTGGTFGNRTDTVLLAGSYRYVRMNAITRSAGNNWGYSIFEMDVFGAVPVASSSSSAAPSSSGSCALGCVTTLNSTTMRATVTGGDVVDIHYTVNGGAQQNVRMNLANGVWTYDIGGLPAGAVVRANFTIIKNGAGQDTEWKNYTLGAGSSSLPSSSRSSSSVPSSVAPSSSRPSSSSVAPPSSSSVASSTPLGNIVPLYNNTTALEPVIKFDRGDALVTRIADRARDRHAKENHFQAYDHYLTFYWEQRTAAIEIVDYVAKGGTTVRMNVVTQGRLDDLQAENRWFYIGMNTLAEYCGNGVMNRINDFNYWKEASWNCRENRPIQIGDRLEFELSQFLDKNSVIRGRDNYYGTTYLYIVGQGIVPWDVTDKVPFVGGVYKQRDSMPMPVNARLGGDTSLHVQMTAEPDGHFQQMATNLSAVNGQAFVLGRRVHHTSFINGGHDENPENGVFSEMVGKSGTRYVSDRCSHCHERNGRAPVAAVGEALDRWVFKVGNAQGNPHPQMGRVLQPQANGGATSEGTPSIAFWTESGGLRSPNYQFTGLRPETFSARLAPQLVGIGLLEAIPESTILAREDINDANGDGISGRAQRIADPVTGQTRLGRFGYKAGTTSVKHQVASAFNTDMGVMTSVLPNPDCGSSQTNCGPSGSELANQHLDNLVKYVALLGVRPQRDYNNAQVINGRTVFNNIGCAGCHVESMTTSQYHPFAELRSQTIRPYTDMLLHDMGPGLADNLGEGQASGAEWRTAPLWGLGVSACVTGGVTGQPGGVPFGVDGNEVCVPKASYLHDGRARTIEEAILWHGGEGQNAKNNYSALSASQKQDLLRFLQSL